ncbi:integral membrane sensor signal transduction histidine kinase [Mycolicibacterium canariasense]|uniref:histidine kinase n=1 Tax=Mycolicibacterium canariasense TaxID=228230 RepID=A0A100WFU2_MYCCR|nr:integral membrane sensor signal transduction histidine kinase [Mycolicibacterium canariasense]
MQPSAFGWRRPTFGLGARLLGAQALVLLAGGMTTLVVAAVVGPPLFREHLRRAGVSHGSDEQFHAEQAYRYATALSTAVAVAVAALTALVVSAYFSRRLQRSVSEVSAAASALAAGHYDIRVAPAGLGKDFDNLAAAFNQMAQRLGSVELTRRRMFSDLAHEIRTPVSVLEIYLQAVEDGVRVMDAETMAMLRDQADRLVRFSQDFAALARAEEAGASLDLQLGAAAPVVRNAVAAAADGYAAKSVTLTSEIPTELPQVRWDPQRIGQVLQNLLDNALRHTPPGGRVRVRVAADQRNLTVTVSDNGDGIPAEHLPHIFERFYRVDAARDRQHGGAGIGLAISKAFAEAHHGDLTAASAGPGHGATFTVVVPIAGPTP